MITKTKSLISFIINNSVEITRHSGLGERWLFMILGFVLAALSPFWAALSILELTFSIVAPLCGIILTLFVGLPLLNFVKWILDTYWFIYSVLMCFAQSVASTGRKKDADVMSKKWTIYQGRRCKPYSSDVFLFTDPISA